jgi:hypothetical protein
VCGFMTSLHCAAGEEADAPRQELTCSGSHLSLVESQDPSQIPIPIPPPPVQCSAVSYLHCKSSRSLTGSTSPRHHSQENMHTRPAQPSQLLLPPAHLSEHTHTVPSSATSYSSPTGLCLVNLSFSRCPEALLLLSHAALTTVDF